MFVVFHVAGDTSDLGIPEPRIGVALVTQNRRMLPQQRKACKPMIKLRHFPGSIVVTFLTLFSLLTVMLIVLLMTVKTIQRRFSKAGQVFMAGAALDGGLGMRIAQYKFGPFMLETLLSGLPILLDVAIATFLAQGRVVLVILLMTG
jgi:hypothetical protein